MRGNAHPHAARRDGQGLDRSRPGRLAAIPGPTPPPVSLIGADLSTVSTQADQVIRVEDVPPWILHLEIQARRDPWLPWRVRKYNALLAERHRLSVSSVVVVLRRRADGRELDSLLRDRHHIDGREHVFPYKVVRVWQQSVDAILAGGIGTLPLAALCTIRRRALQPVIRRMKERLNAEAPPELAARLWAATYVLMGLRFRDAFTARLLEGVRAMEESATYQAIVRKGEEKGLAAGELREARRVLLLLGGNRFGSPDAATRAAVEAIADRDRLEQLALRVLAVGNWPDLLR